jgi:hypothetical protein
VENPLLSLMGFQGPSNDAELLDMAVGEWPPRWWKQMMGQEAPKAELQGLKSPAAQRPPVLPTAHVSGVQQRAHTIQQEALRMRAADSVALQRAPLPAAEVHRYLQNSPYEQIPTLQAATATARSEMNEIVRSQPERTIHEFLTPYVRDTLFPLAGGAPPHIYHTDAIKPVGQIQAQLGGYRVGMRPSGNTDLLTHAVTLKMDESLPHEMGHVLDFRGGMPQLDRIAADNFHRVDRRHYAATNPTEYKAEIFSRAAGILQMAMRENSPEAGYTKMTELSNVADQEIPGVGQMVTALLQHPLYVNSPLNAVVRRRLNQAIGLQNPNWPKP